MFDPGDKSHPRENEMNLRDPFADVRYYSSHSTRTPPQLLASQDDFGPFAASNTSGSPSSAVIEDPFASFSSSFSDDMSLEGMDNLDDSAFDDNFGDFGDFGEFQTAGTSASANTADSSSKSDAHHHLHVETGGDHDAPSDGELTPIAGSWISDLSATEVEGDGDPLVSSVDSIGSAAEGDGVGLGLDLEGRPAINNDKVSKEKEKN